MSVVIKICIVILVLTSSSYKCEHQSHSAVVQYSKLTENSKSAVQNFSSEKNGPSQQLRRELLEDIEKELKNTHKQRKKHPRRNPRNNYDYSMPQMILKPEKIKPGQYMDKSKKKTKNWNMPDYLKTPMAPSDSKISWSFWETDDSESWPDDADDSQPAVEETTTSTTTTTKEPISKEAKGPASVHKHYIYFKKAAPWPSPPMSMPIQEMMPMMPEEMMQEMMKGMIPEDMLMSQPKKKGISGILQKLSAVDPVTIVVAGIIPASLILAAAIPSVMNQIMNSNKGDTMMMPPMMMPPMVSTTAMGDTTTMSSRNFEPQDPASMNEILKSASQFGIQALKDPKCARRKFCQFARKNLLSETLEFRNVLRIAAAALCAYTIEKYNVKQIRVIVASSPIYTENMLPVMRMQDSWLDALGVRDILQSLSSGTCDEGECSDSTENATTQPTLV